MDDLIDELIEAGKELVSAETLEQAKAMLALNETFAAAGVPEAQGTVRFLKALVAIWTKMGDSPKP